MKNIILIHFLLGSFLFAQEKKDSLIITENANILQNRADSLQIKNMEIGAKKDSINAIPNNEFIKPNGLVLNSRYFELPIDSLDLDILTYKNHYDKTLKEIYQIKHKGDSLRTLFISCTTDDNSVISGIVINSSNQANFIELLEKIKLKFSSWKEKISTSELKEAIDFYKEKTNMSGFFMYNKKIWVSPFEDELNVTFNSYKIDEGWDDLIIIKPEFKRITKQLFKYSSGTSIPFISINEIEDLISVLKQ